MALLTVPVVIIAIVVILGPVRGMLDTKPVAGTPPPAAPALTANERAYYAYVAPRLRQIVAETQTLSKLGAERSRNVFALEGGYNRVNSLIGEIQSYDRTHPVPPRFAAGHAAYTAGAATIQRAMKDAQTAFFHFDWNQLNKELAVFNQGGAQVGQAVQLFDREGGQPVAQPTARATAASARH